MSFISERENYSRLTNAYFVIHNIVCADSSIMTHT